MQRIRAHHIILFWTLFAIGMSGVMILVHPITNRPVSYLDEFVWEAGFSVAWLIGTPVVLRLSDRFPLRGAVAWRNGIVLTVCGLALAVIMCAIHAFVLRYALPNVTAWSTNLFLTSLFYNIDKMLIVFVALVTMQHALSYYQRARQQELAAAQLESQLSQAQMTALKMQIQPHFLFNTMNAIVTLVHRDADQAEEMIVRLSDFLRMTLDGPARPTVTLREELEFIRAYLAIEQVRFGGRLTFTEQVPAECYDIELPMLLLQPLIENAIRHGFARYEHATRLTVSARRLDGSLRISVTDDAAPAGTLQGMVEGIGISNTRQRLLAFAGQTAAINIVQPTERGVTVELIIPLRESV